MSQLGPPLKVTANDVITPADCVTAPKGALSSPDYKGEEAMATALRASLPVWFRIFGPLAVIWNAFGVAMYLSSVGVFGDPMAGLGEAERAAAASIPAWIIAAFAIGTFAGLIGSLGLVFRKAWALPVLIVSLIALLVLEGWIVFLSGAVDIFGLTVPIMVSAGAILLAWVAFHARARGWLS
jgi:hypothetical protein